MKVEGDVNHKIQIEWMKWTNASGITCGWNLHFKLKWRV